MINLKSLIKYIENQAMNTIAILPARMGASRFPGKPLHPILGVPMIGHCFYRTKKAAGLDAVYIATCDEVIADYITSIGGQSIMTSADHTRCTDRTAEAMLKIEAELDQTIDIVVMIQGDEPLILPETISDTLKHFVDPEVQIVNVMSKLATREEFEDRNNVKVVQDTNGNALYFSREPIPSAWKDDGNLPMYMQVGVIAFRREALLQFNTMPQTPLEKIESVDMNRVIENGGKIRMVLTNSKTIGVDTIEEANQVEALMMNREEYTTSF
jgi:3-deoxy-manno-octulosonate cytidylyltransferase (CMP-KDO synthetase)